MFCSKLSLYVRSPTSSCRLIEAETSGILTIHIPDSVADQTSQYIKEAVIVWVQGVFEEIPINTIIQKFPSYVKSSKDSKFHNE